MENFSILLNQLKRSCKRNFKWHFRLPKVPLKLFMINFISMVILKLLFLFMVLSKSYLLQKQRRNYQIYPPTTSFTFTLFIRVRFQGYRCKSGMPLFLKLRVTSNYNNFPFKKLSLTYGSKNKRLEWFDTSRKKFTIFKKVF